MEYFFVKDTRHKYRFFSSEPIHPVNVEFSKWKRIWKKAKNKLLLLPPRILSREQAFERIQEQKPEEVSILYSGLLKEKKIQTRFFIFLQKQRTLHILLLILEVILLPVSGLMAFIPGPNVFFAALALVMITHWRALKGINNLLKASRNFTPSEILKKWEKAVEKNHTQKYSEMINQLTLNWNLEKPEKILVRN